MRKLRLSVLAGLAAILFSQAALVLAACKLEGGTPSRSLAVAMAAAEPAVPCHEEAPAGDALCVAHCQASEQALDKQQAKVPVSAVGVVRVVRLHVVRHHTVFLPPERVPVASPPARILFQSLLI